MAFIPRVPLVRRTVVVGCAVDVLALAEVLSPTSSRFWSEPPITMEGHNKVYRMVPVRTRGNSPTAYGRKEKGNNPRTAHSTNGESCTKVYFIIRVRRGQRKE